MSGRYDSLSSPRRAGSAEARRAVPWGLLVVAVMALAVSLAVALVFPRGQIQLIERSLAPDTSSGVAES